MAMPAPLVEHPEVRSAIDLLEAWIEAQRVAHELPGMSLGLVHDQALVWSGGFGTARGWPGRLRCSATTPGSTQ